MAKRAICFFLVLAFLASTVLAVPVKIDDGTIVKVRLIKTLKSGEAQVNELVPYIVVSDVIVNGQVVVAKGAKAVGKVTRSSGRGMFGKSGKLDFTIESVKAIDGSDISLRATQSVKGQSNGTAVAVTSILLFWPAIFVNGRDITVKEGTEFPAYINGDIKIDPANAPVDETAPANGTAVATPAPAVASANVPPTFAVNPIDLDALVAALKTKTAAIPEAKAALAKGRIGVGPFSLIGINSQAVADGVGEILTTSLLSAGYQVADRVQVKQAVQALNLTDPNAIDQKAAQNIGKLSDSSLLMLGSIMDMGNTVSISYRVLDVASGRVLIADRLDNARKIMLVVH